MFFFTKDIRNKWVNILASEFASLEKKPNLALLQVGDDPAINSFVKLKKSFARLVGVELTHFSLSAEATFEKVLNELDLITRSEDLFGHKLYDGLVVQLPLPTGIATDQLLLHLPLELDVDFLNPKNTNVLLERGMLPPVAGAVRLILREMQVNLTDKNVCVVGFGNLVGRPVVRWLNDIGVNPKIVKSSEEDLSSAIAWADVVISGVGMPNLITKEVVKSNQIIIDAGTAEANGVLAGDVSPDCADAVRYLTPVPGGVGPLTIVSLFQNLLMKLGQGDNDELE